MKANPDSTPFAVGDLVRIEGSRDRVTVGHLESVGQRYGGRKTVYEVDGQRWSSEYCAVTHAAPGTPVVTAAPYVTTQSDILAAIEALTSVETPHGLARLIQVDKIIVNILGFDPAWGQSSVAHGGKAPTWWRNQHIHVATINKILSALVADGFIRKVTGKTDRDFVAVPSANSAGWALNSQYNKAFQAKETRLNAAQEDRLLTEARMIVAKRHQAEVQTELARIRAALETERYLAEHRA